MAQFRVPLLWERRHQAEHRLAPPPPVQDQHPIEGDVPSPQARGIHRAFPRIIIPGESDSHDDVAEEHFPMQERTSDQNVKKLNEVPPGDNDERAIGRW